MHIKAKRPGTLKTLLFVNIPKPQSNHKLKIYNRYTGKEKEIQAQHSSQSPNHKRREQKRKGRKKDLQNKSKTINKYKNIYINNQIKREWIKCFNQETE